MSNAFVIAPQWLGDAVMTEPLLRRLAERGERITVGALAWLAPIYRAMPQVAEVIELPFSHGGLQFRERRAIARQIEGRFDTAYILPNSLKSALLPLLAGIPRRVGYLGEARVGFLTHRLKNPAKSRRPPMVAFYSALSGEQGVEGDVPRLAVDPALAKANLRAQGLVPGAYVVFAPGSEYGSAKRWPALHYAELARAVQAQGPLPVVLLGSAKEQALCESISSQASGLCLNLAGKTPLATALQWIATAKFAVSNDSGLMHVAAALGVPQVALFGSSDPRHTPPLSERARVIWLKDEPLYQPPLDCAPCFERECPLGHTRCLNDLGADLVASRLLV